MEKLSKICHQTIIYHYSVHVNVPITVVIPDNDSSVDCNCISDDYVSDKSSSYAENISAETDENVNENVNKNVNETVDENVNEN